MMGRLQCAATVDPIGKALLKNINQQLKPLAKKRLRDVRMPFPKALKASLRRWLRPEILGASLPFRPPHPTWDVYTDASLEGWGVFSSRGHHLQGKWSGTFSHCHINILELVTAFFALKRLPIPRGVHLRLHSDNATAVACLNRSGSARSRPLNSWTLSILHQLEKKGLFLTAFHIAGVRNIIADGLSRSTPLT